MNRQFVVGIGGAALAALGAAFTLTCASNASADTTVVEPAPAPAPAPQAAVVAAPVSQGTTTERADSYTGPNRRLIATGLITFGASYLPALIVAGASNTSADHHLFVPLVGPWLDMGDRPQCGAGHIGCDAETSDKVLLAIDGVFQGIGAITTVWGFLSPERHEVVQQTSEAEKPSVHVSPTNVGSGYGLTAFGSF